MDTHDLIAQCTCGAELVGAQMMDDVHDLLAQHQNAMLMADIESFLSGT